MRAYNGSLREDSYNIIIIIIKFYHFSFLQSISTLSSSTSDIRNKMRFMNDKMMSNDHKMMQIKHQMKDEQKVLKVKQEVLNVKRQKMVQEQHKLTDVQQERFKVRESIRDELEQAKIDKAISPMKDFFFSENTENDEERSNMNGEEGDSKSSISSLLATDNDLVILLKKKLSDKEGLSRLVEPLVKQMNGKFYIRFRKRKQRTQLKSLQKQLVKDVSNLRKALALLD